MTHEECEELFLHQNDPDEWSDEEVHIEVRPLNKRKMPELADTDEVIVCPLCHGQGHTTGKAVYFVVDSLVGSLSDIYIEWKAKTTDTIMRRLWHARDCG